MNITDITKVNRVNVTYLLIAGFGEEYIAAKALHEPISLEEYREWFKDEIENSERRLHAEMAEALIKAARRGNILAITTWLKTRAKWSETTNLTTDKPLLVRIENGLKHGTGN